MLAVTLAFAMLLPSYTFADRRPNHKLEYPIGADFCLEKSVDGYHFTLSCSLQSPVQPVAEFEFVVTQNFSGSFNPLSDYTGDNITNVTVISETETRWSITDGNFIFPETGVIQVNCIVSNNIGNDNATTLVRLCGKE